MVVDVPDKFITALGREDLPPEWDAVPAPRSVRAVGDAWYDARKSLALLVPSALVPQALTTESNLLINATHPKVRELAIALVRLIHRPS